MYARSITFQGDPARQDDGVAYVRGEVLPTISGLDGCVGLSMVLDRESGLSIVTSAWGTRASMRASRDRLATARARGADILGAEPELAEWEVAVMHRRHLVAEGACCRVTWLRLNHGDVDRGIGIYRDAMIPEMESLDGFCSASLLVDRENGRAVNTTVYEGRFSLAASRERAWAIRDAGLRDAGVDVLDAAECDVVLAHLRLPELV